MLNTSFVPTSISRDTVGRFNLLLERAVHTSQRFQTHAEFFMSAFAQPAVTNLSPGVAESIDRVLHSVRSYLGMDVAFVSEFAGPDRVFRNVDSVRSDAPVKVGGVIPMAEGYCQ